MPDGHVIAISETAINRTGGDHRRYVLVQCRLDQARTSCLLFPSEIKHEEEAQSHQTTLTGKSRSPCDMPVACFEIQANHESRTVGQAMLVACRRSCKMHVRETFNMHEMSSRARQMQSPMKPAAPPTPSTPPLWVTVRVQHHTQE